MRAKVTADCLGNRKVSSPTVETDLVIALDTSFCNHYRIEQVKNNLIDLIGTISTPDNGGQVLGDRQGIIMSHVPFTGFKFSVEHTLLV